MPTTPPAGPIGLVQFSKDDAGFRRWASANVRGYVLSHPSPDELMLHFAFCLALHDHRDVIRLTVAGNVCSVQRRDLVQYSLEQTGKAPVRCKTCNP